MKNIKTFESFDYETLNESIGILGAIFLAWCGYKFFKGLEKDIKYRKKLPKEELKDIVNKIVKKANEQYPNYQKKIVNLEKELLDDIESGDCKSINDLANALKRNDIISLEKK